ncbi:MAG: exodeoxyribonuclease VII small subunit, partial [Oscillibacter sp.]|nr:exodeoxyribonuclease VII small subunit [Oscillibacter sp.]
MTGAAEKQSATFEQQIARLEQIVARLEHGDAPLAESLTLFEEGTRLAASC